MKNPYLIFYEKKSNSVLQTEFGDFNLSEYPYIIKHNEFYQLDKNVYIGKIDVKPHFGFLLQEDKDLYIEKDHLNNAMDKDIVLVIKNMFGDHVVDSILKRSLDKIIATISIKKNKRILILPETNIDRQISLNERVDYLVNGHVVLLNVTKITNKTVFTNLEKVIGHIDQPDIETLKIVEFHNWPQNFDDEIYEELNQIEVNMEYEKEARLDLTNLFTMTIDGKDAKDLDDAISITKDDDFYHLGVHIADVSYFVKEGSAIDNQAYLRGTSLYLADRVIPMLPQKLSNDLCSLNPNTDKLTISCLMKIDFEGNVRDYQIAPAVINTNYRLNYDDVNDLINNNKQYDDGNINKAIFNFVELSNILSKIRRKRGALEFESKEIKFVVDEKGRPLNVISRKTQEGEALIESMMLIANETVARHVRLKKYPATYRIHEKPDLDKVTEALDNIKRMGIVSKEKNSASAKTLQIILNKAYDTPFVQIVHMMLLRSMKKAKYYQEPLGHFGLGASDYTHFTSPIRRYSDLYLHRILRILDFDKHDYKNEYNRLTNLVSDVSMQASETERLGLLIEREVIQLKSCEFMLDKVGKKYIGTITSFLRSGMFIELENGIEGFVSLKSFREYLNYDVAKMAFIGKFNEYRLGQKVNIKVSNVDITKRQIDFIVT